MTSIIFMGTPQFAVPILKGLIDNNYQIEAVVTQPDKKIGRKQKLTPTPVKVFAQTQNLPIYQPEKLTKSDELNELVKLHADLIVTAAYGQFLPNKLLDSVKIAPINVHGSLLPKYRGGAPIQYALMNGDKTTGITIMQMAAKMDAGDIYSQESIEIKPEDTAGTLFEKLSYLGRDLLLKTLPKIIDGSAKKTPQDKQKVTFSPNINKQQEKISLEFTARQANDLIRALNPDPGAYIIVNNKRIKVWKAKVAQDHTSLEAGCLVSNKKRFAISFAKNTILDLLEIQPAGKRKMAVQDYLNGEGKNLPLGEMIVNG